MKDKAMAIIDKYGNQDINIFISTNVLTNDELKALIAWKKRKSDKALPKVRKDTLEQRWNEVKHRQDWTFIEYMEIMKHHKDADAVLITLIDEEINTYEREIAANVENNNNNDQTNADDRGAGIQHASNVSTTDITVNNDREANDRLEVANALFMLHEV